VEALRAECVPRLPIEQQTRKQALSFGPLRALPAIAQSYQRFLLCALMSYLPPRRQQEYRELLVEPKPSLQLDAFSGYLYTENNLWYLVTCGRKEGRTRGQAFQLQIPNIQYPLWTLLLPVPSRVAVRIYVCGCKRARASNERFKDSLATTPCLPLHEEEWKKIRKSYRFKSVSARCRFQADRSHDQPSQLSVSLCEPLGRATAQIQHP
jgi:hypothetical protein